MPSGGVPDLPGEVAQMVCFFLCLFFCLSFSLDRSILNEVGRPGEEVSSDRGLDGKDFEKAPTWFPLNCLDSK